MSIYRWAKLDDQSGPDRSIELSRHYPRQAACEPFAVRTGAERVLMMLYKLAWRFTMATRLHSRVCCRAGMRSRVRGALGRAEGKIWGYPSPTLNPAFRPEEAATSQRGRCNRTSHVATRKSQSRFWPP